MSHGASSNPGARASGNVPAGPLDRLQWIGPWLALIALAAWTRELSAWWLVPAAVLLVMWPRRRSITDGLGSVLALAAVAVAFGAHYQLTGLARDWESYWQAREERVFQELTRDLDGLLERGEVAVDELAMVAERAGGRPPPSELEALRRATGFPAVAVYGADGDPDVWDGLHRGRVPSGVRRGDERYVYGELPLFSYLYFTAPLTETGGTAVVAALLRTDLPAGLEADLDDFVSRFEERTGERIRVSRAERAQEQAVYDLRWNQETLFSVSVERPTEMERREEIEQLWIRVVTGLLAAAWLLWGLFGRTTRPGEDVLAVPALAALAVLVPWGVVLADAELFGAGRFLLPGPGGLTAGRLLAISLAGVVAAGLVSLPRGADLPGLLAVSVVAVGYPLLVRLVSSGASPGLVAGTEVDWIVFELTLSGLLALVALGVLILSGSTRETARPGGWLTAALGASAVLAAGVAWWSSESVTVPDWVAALWALPVLLLARALGGWSGWRRAVLAWIAAVAVGTSVALPYAWSLRTRARMTVAEEQLERLGARVDPYLDFLLRRLAGSVGTLYQRGAGSVELLYRGWVESGLAEEGYPIWLTLWSPGNFPQEELRIGVGNEPLPAVASDDLEAVRAADTVVVRRLDLVDAHYIARVPLPDGWVVSAVVPPVREVAPASPLGPLFGTLSEERPDPLALIPLPEGDPPRIGSDVEWVRTREGWEGQMGLTYPDGGYHVRYRVDVPGTLILVARATLLLTLNLGLLLLLWGLGRLLRWGRDRRLPPGWRSLLTSFRARITLALFSFFLLSNAIFGTLAYRNIAGAAQRTARVLAERMANDAAEVYLEVVGRIELLSGRVGGDVLEYRAGQLREAAVEELVELGLYEGWLPYDVHRSLVSGEDLMATRVRSLGRWEYVTAFRRLPDGDILAVPVSLQVGATAVRRREVAHLLAFAIVAGAALSLVLALLVGRALSRPIQTLQVASERVGRGNLGVRLPSQRSDEFGSVFSAFNRMVRRLRRARRDLVRTTRRTQAIVEDAATGVIALDAQGRVTLVNPRAEKLLGMAIEVGRSLPTGTGPTEEFVRWVRLYFRDGLVEAGSEFQFDERRIRVRVRRITRGEGSLGGAVLSLEDVTDELRAERVLAWGEMAQQVAHEVKNPLTPIKLSIQHILRAWEDRRAEFDDILTRNVDAMLREIDRLATIASSFSRFGAPQATGEAPVQPVRLQDTVAEVLALYATGEGAIRFEEEVPDELPAVRARPAEMKEVLVNLLENARAAIADGGNVRVEARRSGTAVELRVRDDGSGIPPELMPRIFEPHFSTRSTGTGLGLAIVRRLVESWNADVGVHSEPDRGTVVTITLALWNGA